MSLTDSASNSVVVPQGSITASFRVSTTAVTAITSVPVSASFNGQTVSSTVTLNPAPPIAVSTLTIPSVVGGQSTTGTVTVNNYPRNAGGIAIALTSGDAKTLQIPSTVTIPQFAFSATFPVTTTVVTGSKGVSVKAVYGTSNVSTTVTVNPIPAISIVQADYLTDTQTLKVAATTTGTTAVLTYGIDPLGPALGTLSFELGQYKGSTTLLTAPASVTVWSADGGKATLAVTQRLSTGGGGGGTTTTYKISISKNGKGSVTTNPSAASYAPGTVVTLTALPDVGSTWTGWTGACTGTALTCTVTVNSNLSVTANFR